MKRLARFTETLGFYLIIINFVYIFLTSIYLFYNFSFVRLIISIVLIVVANIVVIVVNKKSKKANEFSLYGKYLDYVELSMLRDNYDIHQFLKDSNVMDPRVFKIENDEIKVLHSKDTNKHFQDFAEHKNKKSADDLQDFIFKERKEIESNFEKNAALKIQVLPYIFAFTVIMGFLIHVILHLSK